MSSQAAHPSTTGKRPKQQKVTEAKVKITWATIVKQKQLVLMSIPFLIYILLFNYGPLFGWVMAFQNYRPGKGFLDQQWVGLAKFKQLFTNDIFLNSVRNTFAMSFINLIFGFVFSIGFALLLNEVKLQKCKKLMQTVSYLPHFLSWVIVVGLVHQVLSMDGGIINEILLKLHIVDTPISFLGEEKYYWWIVGFTNVWKETGWGSIIYLAAITAINPELYEAAEMDGAGRFRKMLHVTLPGIKSTIFILLIINIGNILNSGFDMQYLLTNGLIVNVTQTIDIYALKYGISLADYSLATAAGIFKSVVSIVLICIANGVSKAAGEERLF